MSKKRIPVSLVCAVLAASLFSACATSNPGQRSTHEEQTAFIQGLNVTSFDGGPTVVEIQTDKPAPYTAFKLVDPPRVVVDLQGRPGSDLAPIKRVHDANIEEIKIETTGQDARTARVVVALSRPLDYEVTDQENVITLKLSPPKPAAAPLARQTSSSPEPSSSQELGHPNRLGEEQVVSAKPRIFFEPRPINLNQVLGLDFTMLEHGKSRLTVTTDKKTPYRVERRGAKGLLMTLENSTIPPLLMRRLDSSQFEGAVDRVKANLTDHRVTLLITLREMVPFHTDQRENIITIDFGRTDIRPPEKTLIPVRVAEKIQGREVEGPSSQISLLRKKRPSKRRSFIPGLRRTKYTGAPMTMDFVNADVTNILRLIGEVSNLNIVWGPEVSGKVSMRLKNVPWDQALDLVLANNDLGQRREGNVIWVTTKAKLKQIEQEEKRKREEEEAAKKKRLEEAKKQVQLEPLETEYFPLDFADADQIKEHIVLSERGSISVDSRTNTIIMKDVASNVEEARKIITRFDEPVKQIMIEARIVDATTDFTRDLGVKWNSIEIQRRDDSGTPIGLPANAANLEPAGLLGGGSFSTNNPQGWLPNIGLSFAHLTGGGAITLDADLALAETEGTVKIISAPKVLASNGEEALISRGDIIYRDIVTADRLDTKELEATLSLTVTPTVSYNNFVTMDIEVTDDQAPSEDRKLEKRIKTKLMVKSGETIVIGGIYKEEKSDEMSGVPWLRDVPGLGWLFKANHRSTKRTELLIFLTPRVVQTGGKKI